MYVHTFCMFILSLKTRYLGPGFLIRLMMTRMSSKTQNITLGNRSDENRQQ